MTYDRIIEETVKYVKSELTSMEVGHDWWHIHRVWQNARQIMSHEKKTNSLVITLGVLLHDIAEPKFHDGDETIGPKKARAFLEKLGVEKPNIDAVIDIIENISFKNTFDKSAKGEEKPKKSLELQIVQDADRLDAIGATGIARAFTYGAVKGRIFYDPEIKPKKYKNKEEYKNTEAPTLNHFYEKLFLLKDMMNTKTGKKLAKKRHKFMVGFVKHFKQEFKGKK